MIFNKIPIYYQINIYIYIYILIFFKKLKYSIICRIIYIEFIVL